MTYEQVHDFLKYNVQIISLNSLNLSYFYGFRIQKDLVDPEKLQETLGDASLQEACDLKRGLEMVSLLEGQLKEMSPNLESISEYVFCLHVK